MLETRRGFLRLNLIYHDEFSYLFYRMPIPQSTPTNSVFNALSDPVASADYSVWVVSAHYGPFLVG